MPAKTPKPRKASEPPIYRVARATKRDDFNISDEIAKQFLAAIMAKKTENNLQILREKLALLFTRYQHFERSTYALSPTDSAKLARDVAKHTRQLVKALNITRAQTNSSIINPIGNEEALLLTCGMPRYDEHVQAEYLLRLEEFACAEVLKRNSGIKHENKKRKPNQALIDLQEDLQAIYILVKGKRGFTAFYQHVITYMESMKFLPTTKASKTKLKNSSNPKALERRKHRAKYTASLQK